MPIPSALTRGVAVDLPAATPTPTAIPLDYSKRWSLVVENTGDTNAINTVRIRSRPVEEGPAGPWETIAGTIAAGATMSVRPPFEPCDASLEVELTSTSGTTAALWLAGV